MMNRRNFLSAAVTLGTLSSLNATAAVTAAQPEKAPMLQGTPAVFAPASDGFTVSTALGAPALVWVEYGKTEQLGDIAGSDSFGFVPHDNGVAKISVSGLSPGTRYFWRLAAAPLHALPTRRFAAAVRSKIYTTKTLAPETATTQFSVWNDTHDHAETIQKLHAARRAEDDFLLWNGDMSNNVNRRAQLPELYLSPKNVDLAEGPPVFDTRGNHDVRGIWANKMSDYVAFPGGRPFYAFRSGPVAAIALDTGEDKPDDHPSFFGVAAFEPLIREQAAWLEEVIRRPALRDAPYRIMFCHIPLRWNERAEPDYDKGGSDWTSRRGLKAWSGALKRWGVQVVISGHMHRTASFPPSDGIPFTQIVGGGPRLPSASLIHCRADSEKLHLEVKKLQGGSVLHEVTFKPLVS
jgi:3',5'-cyclic AMP phosphodiesterase CpdA